MKSQQHIPIATLRTVWNDYDHYYSNYYPFYSTNINRIKPGNFCPYLHLLLMHISKKKKKKRNLTPHFFFLLIYIIFLRVEAIFLILNWKLFWIFEQSFNLLIGKNVFVKLLFFHQHLIFLSHVSSHFIFFFIRVRVKPTPPLIFQRRHETVFRAYNLTKAKRKPLSLFGFPDAKTSGISFEIKNMTWAWVLRFSCRALKHGAY